jgi:hypothetical protein
MIWMKGKFSLCLCVCCEPIILPWRLIVEWQSNKRRLFSTWLHLLFLLVVIDFKHASLSSSSSAFHAAHFYRCNCSGFGVAWSADQKVGALIPIGSKAKYGYFLLSILTDKVALVALCVMISWLRLKKYWVRSIYCPDQSKVLRFCDYVNLYTHECSGGSELWSLLCYTYSVG